MGRRSKINPASLKRVLVTRTDRIGDLVLSTPVFEVLRRHFPEIHLACLTFVENRPIVDGNPFLNEVILYDKLGSERGWWGNFRFARRLGRKRFDAVVHLHATNRMHWVSWLAGIAIRIGYRKKNSWTLTHTVRDRKREGLKHEAEYNFDLLEFLGIEPPHKDEHSHDLASAGAGPYFPLEERDRISLECLLKHLEFDPGRPYVAVNPSASCPSKIWHAERFALLSDRIQEKYSLPVVLIGSETDRVQASKVKGYSRRPVTDLSGLLSLGMLGWLLKRARLLISNDSGPVHIARAVGTPAISIFGRNSAGLSPRRWGPLGDGGKVVHKEVACPVCLAHRCRINFLCLDVVAVDDVFREASRMIVVR